MNWKQVEDRCPICGAPLWESTDYLDYILMEDVYECRNCKAYSWEYITGGYQVFIGNREFNWSYLMPQNEVERIEAEIDNEIDLFRAEIF